MGGFSPRGVRQPSCSGVLGADGHDSISTGRKEREREHGVGQCLHEGGPPECQLSSKSDSGKLDTEITPPAATSLRD